MKSIQITPLQKGITTEVDIPGSKSYTNRALVMAALTENAVRILNPLLSDDTKAMISCLKKLGVKITISKNSIEVVGSINDVKQKDINLDANISGTTLRFLLPLLCVIPGKKILGGKEGLNNRPINVLVDALVQLGAEIEYINKEGFPPIRITSSSLKGNNVHVDGTISSQYFSALLMIAPLTGGLTIHVDGFQTSKPYIDMTIDTMEKFGVQVTNHSYKSYVILPNQKYKIKKYIIEGDFSSAGYFLAIAALTESTITLKNLNPDSVQADKKILDVLKQMGSKISFGKNFLTMKGNGVKPFNIDIIDFPDQAPTLAVLASFANGTTQLSGIQSLRIKETDRIKALQHELKKMNINTIATKTTLTIFGKNPTSATVDTYGDHRMAMSFAVAATKLPGIIINNPEVVTKTFPTFWKELRKIGVGMHLGKTRKKIVLVGFMGSGKSSIAPLLSKKLKMACIEMDQLISERSKESSILKIFEKFGEQHFRQLEQKAAESLTKENNVVISSGGGVVMNEKTMKALTNNAVVIFLSTQLKTIQERLSDSNDRPLWKDVSKTKDLFELRRPLYEGSADIIVQTDGKSQDYVVEEIVEKLEVLK